MVDPGGNRPSQAHLVASHLRRRATRHLAAHPDGSANGERFDWSGTGAVLGGIGDRHGLRGIARLVRPGGGRDE